MPLILLEVEILHNFCCDKLCVLYADIIHYYITKYKSIFPETMVGSTQLLFLCHAMSRSEFACVSIKSRSLARRRGFPR